MNTVLVDPLGDPRWDALVRTSGSLFSSPPWLRTLGTCYGFELTAAVGSTNGAIDSGVAFAPIDDALGPRVVSVPFSDFCDPILGGEQAWPELSRRLRSAGCPVSLRCLDAGAPVTDVDFRRESTALWHRIDLRRDPEQIWSTLGGSARRNVRRARAGGVRVRASSTHRAAATFHALHCEVRRRKYGMLAQPAAFFRCLVDEFAPGDDLVVLLAECDGEPVAGLLLLVWNDTLYYKFNASRAERLDLRPNDLLLWRSVELGRERGLAWLDLGVSDVDQDGLVRYKRKFATEEGVVTRLRHVPAGFRDGRADELRSLLGGLTRLLVDERVSDELRDRAATRIYRYFC